MIVADASAATGRAQLELGRSVVESLTEQLGEQDRVAIVTSDLTIRPIGEGGAQLGDTLTRQHGPELLALVEQVRGLTKSERTRSGRVAGDELDRILEGLTLDEATRLVRAFSVYFYLANEAEQVHRVEELAAEEDTRTIDAAVDRIIEARLDPKMVADVASREIGRAHV